MVPNGNNSVCYGYTVTDPDGSQTTTNIGPVNQSNSMNSNWTHQFNVTINCDQSLTMFLNAWSNQNCGGMHCASPRTTTLTIAPLPVELISFTGEQKGKTVYLTWQTANEVNNKGFNILHSEDGDHFEFIDFVEGYGHSNTMRTYNFTHAAGNGTAHYYRLEQIDFDDRQNLSHIIRVRNNGSDKSTDFGIRNGRLYADVQEETSIQVFSSTGSLLSAMALHPGETFIDIDGWQKGLYFIYSKDQGAFPVYIP